MSGLWPLRGKDRRHSQSLARWDVRKGDNISILFGGQVPFILRQHGETYQLKSECYVHGVMDGEAMKHPRIWRDFALQ